MEGTSDVVLKTLRLIVLKDLSIHAEATWLGVAQDFIVSMIPMCLSQVTTGPTHCVSHTLDLVFGSGQEEGDLKVGGIEDSSPVTDRSLLPWI